MKRVQPSSGRLRLLALAAVVVLALTACGDSDQPGVASVGDPSGAPASPSGQVDIEGILIDFARCVREKGIPNFEDPSVDADGNVQFAPPSGVDPNAFTDAMQACGDKLDGLTLSGGGGDRTETEDAFVKFAECMRDNGIEDFPDPDFSGGHLPFPLDVFHRNDPAYRTAFGACQDVIAGVGPGGG